MSEDPVAHYLPGLQPWLRHVWECAACTGWMHLPYEDKGEGPDCPVGGPLFQDALSWMLDYQAWAQIIYRRFAK